MTDTQPATTMVAPTLAHLAIPIASLRPIHAIPVAATSTPVKESLRHHGQYRPVVANRPTGQVLAGNHVLQAAKELGFPEIAVTFVYLADEEATKLGLVDNRTSDRAGYDDELLVGWSRASTTSRARASTRRRSQTSSTKSRPRSMKRRSCLRLRVRRGPGPATSTPSAITVSCAATPQPHETSSACWPASKPPFYGPTRPMASPTRARPPLG